jgi:dGTP triphosphohydrolase
MPVTASASPDPNEDLSATLQHIGPNKLARTRAALANSPETREFLELGLALLRTDLLDHTGPDLEQGVHSRLFESLSRERIMALAKEWDTEGTRQLGVGMFRNRWERKGQYTEDLIAYLFRLEPQKRHFEEMAEAGRALTKEVSFGELIRLLAAAETEAVMNDERVSLQSILQVALPNHPRVQEFSRAQYEYLIPEWGRLYAEVASAYGLMLADGYTWDDMALLFNSVVEGILIRARTEHNEPKLSNGEGVLSGAIFVMAPSLLKNCPQDLDSAFRIGGK